MEIRQLRSFVAVAEELSFTRAAARLHIAQSALSAQIQALERDFDSPLLERTTRQVRLTSVGEVVLVGARDLIAQSERLLSSARSIARRERDALSIGCLGVIPGALLPRIMERMAADWPQVEIDVHAYDFLAITQSLVDGEVDLAFAYVPPGTPSIELMSSTDTGDIEVIPLADQPRVVVLPSSHRLAERAHLTPSDLAGETFISQSPALSQEWRDFWILTDQLGVRPRVHSRPADELAEWLMQISQRKGIDTAPAMTAHYYPWPNVTYVPLRDAPPATLALLRHRDANEPQIVAFMELAIELADGDGQL